MSSVAQNQTGEAFAHKWSKTETYRSPEMVAKRKVWFTERFGDLENAAWWMEYDNPVLLDAGCGAGVSAIEVFGNRLKCVQYVGVDVSDAVYVAEERFKEFGCGIRG